MQNAKQGKRRQDKEKESRLAKGGCDKFHKRNRLSEMPGGDVITQCKLDSQHKPAAKVAKPQGAGAAGRAIQLQRSCTSRAHNSEEGNAGRMEFQRLRKAEARAKHTPEQHKWELERRRQLYAQRKEDANLCHISITDAAKAAKKEEVKAARRAYKSQRICTVRTNQSEEEHGVRIELERLRQGAARASETAERHELYLERRRQVYARRKQDAKLCHRSIKVTAKAAKKEQVQATRRAKQSLRIRTLRANESDAEHAVRTKLQRLRKAHARANHTAEELHLELERRRQLFAQRAGDAKEFHKSINSFCDQVCDVCKKRCYPHQVVLHRMVITKAYLPQELVNRHLLLVCHRCHTHLKDASKLLPPATAYWNKLNPGTIPDVIKKLNEAETRLLARIIPYIKIVKITGRFGQYGCKGNSVLFAADVHQVSEKLPNMLPRSSDEGGIVVVVETLENLNISRKYTVDRGRIMAALRWLIRNNPLYKDVQANNFIRLESEDIFRLATPGEQPQMHSRQEKDVMARGAHGEPAQQSAYMAITKASRLVRASWHQGRNDIFNSGYAGVQCLAMVVGNIVRAAILPPGQWHTNTVNENMIQSDALYHNIQLMTEHIKGAHPIAYDGRLELRNLDVIHKDLIMYDKSFSLAYDHDWYCGGLLNGKRDDPAILRLTLLNAMRHVFEAHSAGVLIAQGRAIGLMQYNGKYYFTDSHACSPKGVFSKNGEGRACVIECDTIEELRRITRRAFSTEDDVFTISYIDVTFKGKFGNLDDYVGLHPEVHDASNVPEAQQQVLMCVDEMLDVDLPPQNTLEGDDDVYTPVQTSVMAPVDYDQSNISDVLVESENVNEIVRKTKDNIVNANHEKRAEEYAWYQLFPYGINGLNEERDVKISTLDYFQARLLGEDTRFESNDYLFYALSWYEYDKIKTTINASARKIKGRDGAVEDIHLIMRGLRGTNSYWTSRLRDLIAMIRCIGAPTWFLTLSCNDINWMDMRKALLIADKRSYLDPASLTILESQKLIERFPVVVSRHFTQRVNAFLRHIQRNHEVLGGVVSDYWWRIEFQQRGSPHIHMVVWIKDAPDFTKDGQIADGIRFIDNTICCRLPLASEEPELHDLVKRNQIHRHTNTCYKNESAGCRFAFPRRVCTATRLVSQTSDEFLRSGGRICQLKRRSEDKWVNNYCPAVLQLWDGNMDIQPCGSNEGIAHYVAKYIAKSEPTTLNAGVADAIRRIRREETNIARRLFLICNRLMSERQVSACECAYRLCHLPMSGSSRRSIFINSRRREQRYHLIKFDENNRARGVCSNIFERYEKRPQVHPEYNFADMSLAEFAMRFEPHYTKKVEERDEESVDADIDKHNGDNAHYETVGTSRLKFLTLKDNSRMKIRKRPAVVRYPIFNAMTDPENYYYSFMVLNVPYFSEDELMGDFTNSREAFLARQHEALDTTDFMRQYRERDLQLQHALNQAHAFDILDHAINFVDADVEVEEEMPVQRISEAQFQAATASMNLLQRELVKKVVRSILGQQNGSLERLFLFVTGGAGVGKTFTFIQLVEQVNRCYEKMVVRVGAPTGVAAKLIGGCTLHSLFRLPIDKKTKSRPNVPLLTGHYLKIMRQQWHDVEFLFIDEISMVPYQILCMIDSRLKQLKMSTDPFGGINVIVFGDLMQLPPVLATQVFEQPYNLSHTTHLWRLFTLVELTENMRQRGDTTFADLLNALRVGQLTQQHMELLLSKTSSATEDKFALDQAIRIFPTRKLVEHYNNEVIDLYRQRGVHMYTIVAQDTLVYATRRTDKVTIDKIVPDDINHTAGLPKSLQLFMKARVMLRSNINVEKGLVNGAIGTILEIIWPYFRIDQVDPSDIPSVRIDFDNAGIHLIEPRTVQFDALRNYGTVERRMLPLILCWACTVHKLQGCTVDHAVVYLGAKLFQTGQAYAAISRVKSLDGLRILDLDCSKLTGTTPCNVDALQEMERLRNPRRLPDQLLHTEHEIMPAAEQQEPEREEEQNSQ